MKVHIEILTPEGAVTAAKVAAAIAGAMNGGEVAVAAAPRTRRTKAEIEADAAKAAATSAPADPKGDAAAQYEALTGTALAAPVVDTPAVAAVEADPLEAMLAADAAPAATDKTREEMIAAITKLMGEKGVVWTRESIIGKYKVGKFSDMSDELVNQVYAENCV